jgi:DNA polymerase-3 subunit delta
MSQRKPAAPRRAPARSGGAADFSTLAPVYLFHGPEDRRKRAALNALIERAVDPEGRDFDLEFFDGDALTTTGEAVLAAVSAMPMFSERRLVVVTDAGRLRDRRHARDAERLAAGLGKLPPRACLAFVAWSEPEGTASDAWSGRKRGAVPEKLEAAIRAAGKILLFSAVKPEEAAGFAVAEAAERGKKLPPALAAMLVRATGPDLDRVANEVEKLVQYAGEQPVIGPEDLRALVPAPPDDNIFHLLDAIGDRQGQQALRLLGELLESGEPPWRILTMIARQLRLIWQAKYLLEEGVSLAAAGAAPEEVKALLPADGGILPLLARQPFQASKLARQARAFSWEQLQRGLDRLVKCDAGTKGWESGVDDPVLALELLVLDLCA